VTSPLIAASPNLCPGTVTIAAERICAVVDRRRRLGDVAGSAAALFVARQLLEASCSRDADPFAVQTMDRLARPRR
jgi:hypothetical protein